MTGDQHWDVHAKLEDPMGVLAIALAQWDTRDDTQPQPHVRQAANTAMDAIDAMVRDLYVMRSRLVSEIRVSDDAAGRRVDDLLNVAGRVADLEQRARDYNAGEGTRWEDPRDTAHGSTYDPKS